MRLSSYEVVFMSGHLAVKPSSCQVVPLSGVRWYVFRNLKNSMFCAREVFAFSPFSINTNAHFTSLRLITDFHGVVGGWTESEIKANSVQL